MDSYYASPPYSVGPYVEPSLIPPSKDSYQRVPTPGDVPTAVHNLLSSTKKLQEALKLWSVEQTTEADLSDIYVLIVHQFNDVISAFDHYRISLDDLHDVPAELRVVLEHCLGEDPSPAVLTTYTPDLHKVLVRLLKGLQSRQEEWRVASGQVQYNSP